MEPKFEAPRDIPRQTPEVAPDRFEVNPVRPPEQLEIQGYETARPASTEMSPSSGPVAAPIDPQAIAAPSPTFTSQMPPDPMQTVNDDVPIVANDDDLIEKEWVDKAKQIIADTREDPYRREQEISKLQVEYIRRRYGREIGGSSEV